MTPEEMAALIDELKAENQTILNSKKEILNELKKERQKNKEVDIEAHYKLQDEFENMKSNFEKLQKQYKLDVDKLNSEISQKDSYLSDTLIKNGLRDNLMKQGLKPEAIDFAMDNLQHKAKVVKSDNGYNAVIDDKSLDEYIPHWLKEGSGKFLSFGTPDAGVNTGGKGAEGVVTKPEVNKRAEEAKASGNVNEYLQAIMQQTNNKG